MSLSDSHRGISVASSRPWIAVPRGQESDGGAGGGEVEAMKKILLASIYVVAAGACFGSVRRALPGADLQSFHTQETQDSQLTVARTVAGIWGVNLSCIKATA